MLLLFVIASIKNCRKYSSFQSSSSYRTKRGGGGAPLRSSTGQIITKLREDPLITFNDSARQHVENHLRYKTTFEKKKQYKMELDRCRADRIKRDNIRNRNDMVCEWINSFFI